MLLSYDTLGPDTAPTLVFLHGLGASRTQSTSSLPNLQNTRLIAPDMPGHGDSMGFDPTTYSFDTFADHVIALMDHLGIAKTHLGGISMGSGISLNIALRYPEHVNKLILLRPSWLDSPEPAHLAFAAKPSWKSEAEFQANPEFQALLRDNPPVAQSVLGLYDRPDNSVLEKMWRDCPFQSLASLEKITSPALVLSTPRDELHPQHVADQIAAHLTDVQTDILPARYHEKEAYLNSLNTIINNFLK